MNSDKYLYIIGGPTASGKTAKAIEEAQRLDTVVISADSRQFYREMNIGTAKPEPAELQTVPHYFINNLSIHDKYDVGMYELEVLELLEHLFITKDVVVMAGGSGLYIKAITDGLDYFPEISDEIRYQVNKLFEESGIEKLREIVALKDPDYYAEVDVFNPRRLVRAAEVILQTGQTYSGFRKGHAKKRPFNIIKRYLHLERPELYQRINLRVDQMVDAGLEEEARSLFPFKHFKALQTVGYQEWFDFFEGKISRVECIELIKQNTRRYAKRQTTWFRNDGGWSTDIPELFL